MAELYPMPLGLHLRRIFHEHRNQAQIYDLPSNRFWRPQPDLDLSVKFHGMPASTAVGPAAGPQDQLIQNIILSWLGGSRIMELKTVQIMDELEISRPCIYAGHVGLNVEWSQELKLEQSFDEYVGASMIVDILKHTDLVGFGDDLERATHTIFDLSVGYDLKGISSEPIRSFIERTKDATADVDRLRQEIPDEFKQFRDLDFRTDLVHSITLSTFHGCPKDEIERICEFLLTEMGVNTIIKLNPTQLDKPYLEHLLHEKMGYTDLTVNPKAYDVTLTLDEAVAIVQRLEPIALERGLQIGVKFSNTLEVLNKGDYFSDEVMYMSGPPLHVIAMTLVEEWRKKVGGRYPVTFAAGIDNKNFADAMALGLTPITSCTDLLKTRGYARQIAYLEALEKRMKKLGVTDIPNYVVTAYGKQEQAVDRAFQELGVEAASLAGELKTNLGSDAPSFQKALKASGDAGLAAKLETELVRQAALLNTPHYAALVREDARYTHAKNSKAPKKIGSALYLMDCVACGKCVPVCPNDANFTYPVEPAEFSGRNFKIVGKKVLPEEAFTVTLKKAEQWAVYADFCNECGNCDVFCPEEGGPFMQKPKFFGEMETWKRHDDRDGFYLQRQDGKYGMWGRFDGREYFLEVDHQENATRFTDHVVEVLLNPDKPAEPLEARIVDDGRNGHVLDMKCYFWMMKCLEGVMDPSRLNYINIRHLADSEIPSK